MADKPLESHPEKQFKFMIIGDSMTGKTCLASRFSKDQFDKLYKQTVGIDFHLRRITLPGGVHVTIQISDIGGQSLCGQMLDKYLYGSDAILFVYDLSNYHSFENLYDWLAVVKHAFHTTGKLPQMALVANKGDLEHMKSVRPDKYLKFVHDNKMSFHTVSAKTGESVYGCFQKVAAEMLGIRLTKVEQENVQPVVKAEIDNYRPIVAAVSPSTAKTAICDIQ